MKWAISLAIPILRLGVLGIALVINLFSGSVPPLLTWDKPLDKVGVSGVNWSDYLFLLWGWSGLPILLSFPLDGLAIWSIVRVRHGKRSAEMFVVYFALLAGLIASTVYIFMWKDRTPFYQMEIGGEQIILTPLTLNAPSVWYHLKNFGLLLGTTAIVLLPVVLQTLIFEPRAFLGSASKKGGTVDRPETAS